MRDTIWSRTLPAASRATLLASDPLPATADVVVVGAGLVGLCTACSLVSRGTRGIALLDRVSIGGGATGASAGGLWPGHECLTFATPLVARKAADLHARLRAEFPCDHVPGGLLKLVDEGAVPRERARVDRVRQAGFDAELLAGPEVERCEPRLRRGSRAVWFPQDGSIHPLKLAAALAAWLRRHGVAICLGQAVRHIEPSGAGVRTKHGRIGSGAVVVAAGAWTPLLTRLLGWEPPIRPIRGTLLATGSRPPGTIRSVVVGPDFYYWQLACGPLAGGGSEEDVGFSERPDLAVADRIRTEFRDLFPALRAVSFGARWTGFRPFCEDMQPVVGPVPGQVRVFVSAGHFRKGILLAPLSGELLADEMLEGRRWQPAVSFRPDRFAPARAEGARSGA